MELDFLDWDTVLAMGPQGMGWRSDCILALFVLLSSKPFSSLVVVSGSKSPPALIYHKSLSKKRNFGRHSSSFTVDEQLLTTSGS